MKKKILLCAVIATAICTVCRINFADSNENIGKLSRAVLDNIEALSHDESLTESDDCRFINGYKSWYSEKPNPYIPKSEFYDCCKELRNGYCPCDICR